MDQTPKRRKTESDDPALDDMEDEWARFQSEVVQSETSKPKPSVLDQYTPDLEAKAVDIHGKSVTDGAKDDVNALEIPEDLKQRELDNLEEAVNELQQEEEVQSSLKSRFDKLKELRNKKPTVEKEVVAKESDSDDSDEEFDEEKLWSQRGI